MKGIERLSCINVRHDFDAKHRASLSPTPEGLGRLARPAMIGRRLAVAVGLSICLSVCLSACGGHATSSALKSKVYTGCATAKTLPASTASAGGSGPTTSAAIASDDWPQFGYTNQRSNDDPMSTGITAANLSQLTCRTVKLPGTADSSAIELNDVKVNGQLGDVIVVTTSYGHTLAIDPSTGRTLWEFTPADISSYAGSAQFTTASPTADPDHRYVYVATPDGEMHKLSLATGHEVQAGQWPVRVTFDPTHEKLASPASIDGSHLIVATDGYGGDIPPYQGHVVEISRATGQIQAVFNSLCSNVRHLMDPKSCPFTDSAIWGRAGAVIKPNGDILVATSNGESTETTTFNGRTNWSDSVLELSANKLQLLHNWTPTDQLHLTQDDLDLGSTSPALLPGSLAVQGGKSGLLSLLDLNKLDGTTGPAGPRTGGQLQTIAAPGSTDVFSQPAVATISGKTYVFVTTADGTEAYQLIDRRLQVAWHDTTPGTSPVIAGNLLYVYDQVNGSLIVRSAQTGRQLASLPVGPGHWNSPIVADGMIILPTGSADDHLTTGALEIYHLPGH